jgi:outer membrane protein assembly factor BamB
MAGLMLVGMGLGLGWLLSRGPGHRLGPRIPIPENDPARVAEVVPEDANLGTLIPGPGKPGQWPGLWPWFRGPRRDNIAAGAAIASAWGQAGPSVLWRVELGEGHAGAAVRNGRVYVSDYDEKKKEDLVRCLSLDTGEEIWRFSYYSKVKRNHGMSRTVCAVTDEFVVALGPKCDLVCLNAVSGERIWQKDLVRKYETRVPEWYAGQCPLVEGDRLILAPGGKLLMTALRLADGEPVWETPNPDGWQMTHSSILPVDFAGKRQYVWCATGGAVGVDAGSGHLLWKLTDWKIKIANVPTPVDLEDGRILLSGGYNAGAMMIRLRPDAPPEILFRTKPDVFGSDQQTPIYHGGLIYGVIPGGRLACLSPEGRQLWVRDDLDFGLGPFLLADGKLLVLDDRPVALHLLKISATGAEELARHEILTGHDAWAPMAFAAGRLLARDANTLVCLDLR